MAANDGVMGDRHMTPQADTIGDGVAVTDLAVMPYVAIRHQQIAITNPGDAASVFGTSRDGNTLAKDIVLTANESMSRAWCGSAILRRATDHRKGEHMGTRPEGRVRTNHSVWLEDTAGAYDAMGPNNDTGPKLGIRSDLCGFVDVLNHRLPLSS